MPLLLSDISQNAKDRFLDKVLFGDGCWSWLGSAVNGRGRMRIGASLYLAPRIAWRIFRNTDPGDDFVLHHCDNPNCVRPSHLFLGDHQKNSDDKFSKGRFKTPKGSDHPSSRLCERQVREILTMAGTYKSIAAKYGVTTACIESIKCRHSWKHVEVAEKDIIKGAKKHRGPDGRYVSGQKEREKQR